MARYSKTMPAGLGFRGLLLVIRLIIMGVQMAVIILAIPTKARHMDTAAECLVESAAAH